MLGEILSLSATAAGRDSAPSNFTYRAAHLKPLSPAHLCVKRANNTLSITWVRRSRIEGDNWLGEVPLGETSERYRLRLWNEDTLIQEVEINEPHYEGPNTPLTHTDVAQGSNLVGWGAEAELRFSPH